ncbi:MAG: Holliday junction resolvase RuvX [Gammaproteobacteria bacterium]|jgi:putative holliday junction resolvase|nr:Holliday junction resolvase RuvX [Gammaproteobacteria bacterium]MBT4493892.1 Holliday junction resolvase RuvX [Gammaproteobacteria bacterium]MBT7372127.1 Holliday junction resolvase RuvX [Gammaproteobacteria bacterium]
MAELIMGFDFGTTRIGIAVGQKVTASASPVAIISARDGKPDWRELDRLIGEWQPCLFVVGLPLNMDDSMSDMAEAAMKFARRLSGRYEIPHEMMDERLSTFEAKKLTDSEEVDAVAAQLILETWLST